VTGGLEVLYSGGTASGTTVRGGEEYVAAGAMAVSATISSGGTQLVYGTASGATVSTGGQEFVLSGGVASGTLVSTGGVAVVESGGIGRSGVVNSAGGTDLGAQISGGTQFDYGLASGASIFVAVAPEATSSSPPLAMMVPLADP
jgi:autotransporter passenger strand-loop-strand repeat protein